MHLEHGAANKEDIHWIFINNVLEKVHLLKGKEINWMTDKDPWLLFLWLSDCFSTEIPSLFCAICYLVVRTDFAVWKEVQ